LIVLVAVSEPLLKFDFDLIGLVWCMHYYLSQWSVCEWGCPTARRHASALPMPSSCVCLSVCLSVVTSRCCTETAKCRITQTTPHDILGTHSDAEDLGKTQTGLPQRRRQMQVVCSIQITEALVRCGK